MKQLIDKFVLYICSMMLYLSTYKGNYVAVPILIALFFACLIIYADKPTIKIISFFTVTFLCMPLSPLTFFLPVFIYDYFAGKYFYFLIFELYILNYNMDKIGSQDMLFLILFLLLSFYLKYKTMKYESLQKLHNQSINLSQELMLIEEEKNRSILENQDYEINIATLSERNRISKEIHDHIGHVLSRALIQIGALLTLEQNPLIKEELSNLKASLSEGMDSIRASIHNMHDESIDLYSTVKNIINNFQFCSIQYHYDIVNPPLLKVKYCFIAIVKEALSNIMKHSDAKNVIIVLAEEPALYRLIIDDNGTVTEKTKALARKIQLSTDSLDSMGLRNMSERVKGLNGTFQIIANNGFKILISIPKEKNGGNT